MTTQKIQKLDPNQIRNELKKLKADYKKEVNVHWRKCDEITSIVKANLEATIPDFNRGLEKQGLPHILFYNVMNGDLPHQIILTFTCYPKSQLSVTTERIKKRLELSYGIPASYYSMKYDSMKLDN